MTARNLPFLACSVFFLTFHTLVNSASGMVDLVEVSITSTESDPTSADPIPITFTFGESVTGFDVSDITPTNGSLSNFAGSGDTYTVDISPTAEGSVQVAIPEGAGTGEMSTNDTEADFFSILYDLVGVTITSTEPDPTSADSIPITFTFDEAVNGFDISDITPINGTLSNFAGSGDTYTVDISPSAEGPVQVDIAKSAGIGDVSGSATEAASFSITSDDAPTFTTSFSIVNGLIQVTVSFSEDVTGFEASDITVINGTLGNFAGSGDSYTFNVLSPTGKVTVQIADAAAQDSVGNNSIAAMPMFTAPSRPDLLVGTKSSPASQDGDNVYSSTTFKEKRIKGTSKFFVSIQNDGIATDTFGGRSKKSRKFKVTYKLQGGGNITGALKTGNFQTTLASGSVNTVKAQIKPKKKSIRSQTFKDIVTIFAIADPSISDQCKMKLNFLPTQSADGRTDRLNPSGIGPGINP